MKNFATASVVLTALLSPVPSFAQPTASAGPAQELVQFCKMVAEQQPQISVGQCLSIEREKSTDSYAASCRYVRDQGLFPIDPDDDGPAAAITNVGECIAYIRSLEVPPG